jgi:hypothetical protein
MGNSTAKSPVIGLIIKPGAWAMVQGRAADLGVSPPEYVRRLLNLEADSRFMNSAPKNNPAPAWEGESTTIRPLRMRREIWRRAQRRAVKLEMTLSRYVEESARWENSLRLLNVAL